MTKKELKAKLKSELKQMAKDIKKAKPFWRKFNQAEFNNQFSTIVDFRERWAQEGAAMTKLKEEYPMDSDMFRHRHIAYCMFRGRSYEQIEPKVLPGNEPNKKFIENLLAEYAEIIKENEVV